MKKGFIPVVFSCLLAVPVMASCGEEPVKPEPVVYHVSITNKDELTAAWTKNGANRTMGIAVDDPNANVTALINNGSITITSDHADVVRVTGKVLSAVGVGSAKITVKYGESTDTVDITVAAPEHGTEADDPLTAEEAVAKAKELDSGETTKVLYYVTGIAKTATWDAGYGNGEIHLDAGEDELILYRFVMDDSCTTDPATIKPGMTIKAYGNLQNYQGNKWEMPQGVKVLSVTENTIPCTKLEVNAESASIETGEVYRIEATAEPATTTDTLSFESDAPSIASVDAKGRVTGLAVGTANIKVKCGAQEKSVAVTVNAAVPGAKTLEKIDYISASGLLPASKPAEAQTVTVEQLVPGQEEKIKVNFEGFWATSPSSYGNTLQSNAIDDYIHGDPDANLYVHKIRMDIRKYVNIEVYASNDLSGDKIIPVNISGRAGADDHVINEYTINSKTWSIKANYNGTSHYHSMQLTVGTEPMAIEFTGLELPVEELNMVQGQVYSAPALLKDPGVEGVDLEYRSWDETVATVDQEGNIKMLGAKDTTTTIQAVGTKDDKTFSDSITVTSLGGSIAMGTTPDAETDYFLGVKNTNLPNMVYATGVMSGNYGGTTELVESAAKVRFIAVSGGYQMKVTYKDGAGADVVKYLEAVVASNKYTNISFKDSPTDGFKWEMDTEHKFFKTDVQGYTGDNVSKNGYYYLGIQNAYNTLSLYTADNATKANNFPAWGYTLGALPQTTAIAVDKTAVSIEEGKTEKVLVTATPADALAVLTWTSSDPKVATVEDGVIFGVKKGTCQVTVTEKNYVDDSTTPDLKKVIEVKVKEPYTFVGEGTKEKPYTVADAWHVVDELDNQATTKDPFYMSGYVTKVEKLQTYGSYVLWVDDTADGSDSYFEVYNLKSFDGGNFTEGNIVVGDFITINAKGKLYNTTHETDSNGVLIDIVQKTPATLTSVSIEESTLDVSVGVTSALTYEITPSFPFAHNAVWSSSDETVATVNAKGEVTGVAVGKATITLRVGDLSDTCEVTVVKPIDKNDFDLASETINLNGSITPNPCSDDEVKFTGTNVFFDVAKGGSSTAAGGDKQGFIGSSATPEIRLYKNQLVTIAPNAAENAMFEVLVYVTNSNSNFEGATFTNCTCTKVSGSGSIKIDNPYVYKLTGAAKNFQILVSAGATRITKLEITYGTPKKA